MKIVAPKSPVNAASIDVCAEVLRLHAEGLTSSTISRQVGRCRERVRQILKEKGLTPNYRTKPAENVVVALYEEGLTDADIACELGVSKSSVTQVRKGAGVQGRVGPPLQLVPSEIERLLARARQGWRQVDIAAEFGVAQKVVSKIMRRHGIERQVSHKRRVKT